MKPFYPLVIFFLLWSFSEVSAGTVAPLAPKSTEVIGIATSSSRDSAFDQHLKGDLDKLVPRIRKMYQDEVILIEAYYPAIKSKSGDDELRKAYSLAEQAQLYLQNKHSLSINFYISIWSGVENSKDRPQLRLTSYPKAFFEN